ncbi:MAG TPA: AAA family ATPase [Fimbriimonadaceae bacterium]|nr:AAA family ATPase [Fimbriimonadaceae bacterium]HRJ34094.1 AAA family ATPase [Fimbriimonadaceae bacterium]
MKAPETAMLVACQQMLEAAHPGAFIQSVESHDFDPEFWDRPWEFGPTENVPDPGLMSISFHEELGLMKSLIAGRFQIRWEGVTTQLYMIQIPEQYTTKTVWFVIGEDESSTLEWSEKVCRVCARTEGVIFVFQNGCWWGSRELYLSIESSSLDDLVLPKNQKEEIVSDIEHFLTQEATYQQLNVAWKRGILLLGAPGNGKTHLIRALARSLKLPTLYVKSLEAQHSAAQSVVATAFQRARKLAPCLFVLEDLDTLIEGKTRTYFLNELDGFENNRGILTIATCNYPEKLDAAILERPSRFDRKYHFELPALEQRTEYLRLARDRFSDQLPLSEEALVQVAKKAEGYSYAYLKELMLSSVVGWISSDRKEPLEQVMRRQVATLLLQMRTDRPAPSVPDGNYWSDD